jgi:NADH dehydrogenase [ubiquinone] 1 alpha subcomplex assembly factor 1
MNPGFSFSAFFILMNSLYIFNFNKNADINTWRIVDDVVMGGKSSGNFELNPGGYGRFWGDVSLEHNGGFSSVRCRFTPLKINSQKTLSVRIKGDGKDYQLRLKPDEALSYAYITTVSTSGDWQEISVPLSDFYPSFRGRKLDQANFKHEQIAEFTFLIANKRDEQFELLIDWIKLD